jgi:hypothetical protein
MEIIKININSAKGTRPTRPRTKLSKRAMDTRKSTNSARSAGYSENKLMQPRPGESKDIQRDKSEQAGNSSATEHKIMRELNPKLHATKKTVVRPGGKVAQVMDLPDQQAQLSAICDLLELMGALPPRGRKVPKTEANDTVEYLRVDPPAETEETEPCVKTAGASTTPPDIPAARPDPRPPDGVDAVEYPKSTKPAKTTPQEYDKLGRGHAASTDEPLNPFEAYIKSLNSNKRKED